MFGRRGFRFVLLAALLIVIAAGTALRLSVEAEMSPIVQENAQTGQSVERVGCQRRGRSDDSRVRHRHQRQHRARRSRSRSTPTRPTTASTSIASATTAAWARARSRTSVPSAALPQIQPACLVDGATGPGRLRQLGGLGVVGRAARRGLGHLHREADAPRHAAAPATSSSSCATMRGRPTCCSRPPTRRGRPTTATAATASTRRPVATRAPYRSGRAYKVSYNRPFDTREPRRDRASFQRRIPDGALARGQRLRRQVLDGRRHRPPRRDLISANHESVPLGRPRRILVGGAARQCRGGARRRRQPGVLQRQRGVLEDAVGDQHRRRGHAVPHAGQLQGDARERRRSIRRPNVWTGTWRDPRFSPPADGGRPENALTGTICAWSTRGTAAITRAGAMAKLRFWRTRASRT